MSRKILIIDDYDDLATALTREFTKMGHFVKTTENRAEAVVLYKDDTFDMVITDLDGEKPVFDARSNGKEEFNFLPKPLENFQGDIKAFKICLANYGRETFDENEVNHLIKSALNYKAKFIDRGPAMKNRHEKIEFEVPSIISSMHDILGYLIKRVEKLGVVSRKQSNLLVALDEAFVNAVKHGNKFDTDKLVRISVEISPTKASFTIEDEGDGFDVEEIPDPTNPENLFKTSGRGVMFIYNIMDEVIYNSRGNRVTMIKKSDNNS